MSKFSCFLLLFLTLSLYLNSAFAEENIDDDDLFSELEAEYETPDNKKGKEEISVNDPFQSFNRAMFVFNDKIYIYVLDPVSKGYEKITPKVVRKGLGNFFTNLFKPISVLNNLLQFQFKDAGKQTASFVINTTVGLLGIFDVSSKFPSLQKKEKEDFGQTLGRYGIGDGFYIVLPFLGPTTLRDSMGMTFDSYLTYQEYLKDLDNDVITTIKIVHPINSMGPQINQYKELKKIAVDPYTAIRNGYIQKRKKDIKE